MEKTLLTAELKENMLTLISDYYEFNDELVTREYNPIELSDFLKLMETAK